MTVIATYLTKTGIIAFQVSSYITRDGSIGYSYTGRHGAGCGSLKDIAHSIKTTMQSRKGIRFDSGVDITISEDAELLAQAMANYYRKHTERGSAWVLPDEV